VGLDFFGRRTFFGDFGNKRAYEIWHSPCGPCARGGGGCGGVDPEQKNLLKRQIVGLYAIHFRVAKRRSPHRPVYRLRRLTLRIVLELMPMIAACQMLDGLGFEASRQLRNMLRHYATASAYPLEKCLIFQCFIEPVSLGDSNPYYRREGAMSASG
jgi:hypothetical protein